MTQVNGVVAEVTARPLRILHFVTGGFSGATQVAVDLCLAAQRNESAQVMLVLRRKRNTSAAHLNVLREQGLHVQVVPGWAHMATMWSLRRLATTWKPDILVAHGFSEHLWGRYAGLMAKVPHLVHVEHNSRERYTLWRLAQARWLARRTDAIVGVSEGVHQHLLKLGFAPAQCMAIPNGIDLKRFPTSNVPAWEQRENAIVMSARFSRQKDHGTLINAMALLAAKGVHPELHLAGLGKTSAISAIRQQVKKQTLAQQVHFLGHVPDIPALLAQHRIFVLATHYEGMPLALLEAMAAGCACIGSDVVGVREVIRHDQTGLLVPPGDAQALAQALEMLLTQPERAAALGAGARQQALAEFDISTTQRRYTALFQQLAAGPSIK